MVHITEESDVKIIDEFIPIQGKWEKTENIIRFIGLRRDNQVQEQNGLVFFPMELIVGRISAKIKFIEKCIARLVIGIDPKTGEYYSIGLGGYNYRYVIDKYEEGKGWRGLALAGYKQEIEIHHPGYRPFLRVEKVG